MLDQIQNLGIDRVEGLGQYFLHQTAYVGVILAPKWLCRGTPLASNSIDLI
jgi:hypothetical protein